MAVASVLGYKKKGYMLCDCGADCVVVSKSC